ncbi:MAG: AAA family ATPase [Silvibacterium sp.]|nr:AAA family ATPase [Silvibacterium sp.]
MRRAHRNTPSLDISVLTVCVDQDSTEKLEQATQRRHWNTSHESMTEYISAVRRPAISLEAKKANAVLAVVDFDRDPQAAEESATFLKQLFHGKTFVAALSSRHDSDLLLKAMRAGCNEVLRNPLDETQLAEMLERQNTHWLATMGHNRSAGKVLSFFGCKGGVGTTTIAVNFAHTLTRLQKKVLLIDNHAEFGHVCLYLGLDGNRYHFHELIRNVNRLDSELLRGFIARHSSGLEVLSSPELHDPNRSIDPDALERTIDFLRGEYDYLILDCETNLTEVNLAVMDSSDEICLVATPEIGAVRDLSRYIDNLSRNEQATTKLHIVINRYSSTGAIGIEQIEKAIRVPVQTRISNNYSECQKAINLGEPVSAEKKTDFIEQLSKWAGTLAGTNGTHAPKNGRKKFSLWG